MQNLLETMKEIYLTIKCWQMSFYKINPALTNIYTNKRKIYWPVLWCLCCLSTLEYMNMVFIVKVCYVNNMRVFPWYCHTWYCEHKMSYVTFLLKFYSWFVCITFLFVAYLLNVMFLYIYTPIFALILTAFFIERNKRVLL